MGLWKNTNKKFFFRPKFHLILYPIGQYKKYRYFINFVLDLKILQQRISASHQVFEWRIGRMYFYGFRNVTHFWKSIGIQVEKLEVFPVFLWISTLFLRTVEYNRGHLGELCRSQLAVW